MAEHPTNNGDSGNNKEESKDWSTGTKIAVGVTAAAALGVASVVAVPLLVGALGFGATGIASGSVAAAWMSSAAVANGGGVAAGSAVAILQSIGAVGLSTGAAAGIGASVTTFFGGIFSAIAYVHKANGKECTKYREIHTHYPELAKLLDFSAYLIREKKFAEARATLERASAELQKATNPNATDAEAIPLLRAALDLLELRRQASEGLGNRDQAEELRAEVEALKVILERMSTAANQTNASDQSRSSESSSSS